MSSTIVKFEGRFIEKHGKSFLMALNIIYTVVALMITSGGIWFAFYDPSGIFAAILISIGLLLSGLYFFGFWTTLKEHVTGLKVYAWILLVLEILTIIKAITSLAMSSNTNRTIDENENKLTQLMFETTERTYISILIQFVCIYVAIRYSTVLKKAKTEDSPPDYSKI